MTEEQFIPAPLQDRQFILGGIHRGASHPGSIFSLHIPDSFVSQHGCADHFTYKVKFKPANGDFDDAWMVSLLNGPDNWRNYVYIGMLNPDTGEFRTTRGSRAGDDAWSVRLLRRALACLWNDGEASLAKLTAAGFALMHVGKCGMCGKRLTVPLSIERGFGPTCWAKLG